MTRVGSLREVVEKSTGTRNPAVQPDDEFTYVDVSAIDNQQKIINGARLLLGSEAPSRARKLLRADDVLVSTVRPNLNAVALVPSELDGQVGSTGFCVLRAMPSRVLPEYLFYFVRSQRFVDALAGLVAGALYPAVTDSQVLDQELPLPSLSEQRRIVDLLSRAEGVVRLRHQAQQKAAALIPAIFVDMFGDPATNPNRWPLHQLSDLLADTKLGLVRGAKEMGSGLAYPYLRMDAVGSGYVQLRGLRRVDACPKEVADYSLKEGDFLFNTRNSRELVGKTGVVAAEPPESTLFNNNLMRMRFHKDVVLPLFVNWQFQTDHVQRQLDSIKRGTTTVFAVYYKDLKNLQLVVPAIDRQRQFSERATQILRIQQQQREATEKAEAAFGALLARSFCGAAAPAAVPSEEATEA